MGPSDHVSKRPHQVCHVFLEGCIGHIHCLVDHRLSRRDGSDALIMLLAVVIRSNGYDHGIVDVGVVNNVVVNHLIVNGRVGSVSSWEWGPMVAVCSNSVWVPCGANGNGVSLVL